MSHRSGRSAKLLRCRRRIPRLSVELASPVALDLTTGALAGDAARWLHLTDYEPCQSLAETARGIGAEVIRYASVRDPAHGANFAVLSCRAFRSAAPVERQTWRIRINRSGAQAVREYPRLGMEFPPDSFADEPRLAGMAWDRPRAR